MIDERRSSDKGVTPDKPATEAADTANVRYSRTAAAHSAKAAETANVRYSRTTAAAHSTKATKPRLRRSCYQRGANHSRCREHGESLMDHGVLLFLDGSPRGQFSEL